jgi:hypothetical protein
MRWLENYLADPFGFVDRMELKVSGHDLNFFRHDEKLRESALWFTGLCIVLWVVTGWDGAEAQLEYLARGLYDFALGRIDWGEVVRLYYSGYGQWLHWNSLIVYGFVFYYSGKYFRGLGVVKSLNVVMSLCFTFLSIGVFEVYWMTCYAFFQNQWWVVTWVMPQARILIQNFSFTVIGIMGIVYFGGGLGYRWRPTKLFVLASVLSVVFAVTWVFYPFPVTPFSIGGWSNTNLFPQTLYTIELTPFDGINAGEAFFVEDNLIHFFNVVVKGLMGWAALEAARGWRKLEPTS